MKDEKVRRRTLASILLHGQGVDCFLPSHARQKNVQSAASKDGITRCHHSGPAKSHPNPPHWSCGLPRGVGTPHLPSYAVLPSEQVQQGWNQAEQMKTMYCPEKAWSMTSRENFVQFSLAPSVLQPGRISMRSREGAITSCKGYLHSSSADVEL